MQSHDLVPPRLPSLRVLLAVDGSPGADAAADFVLGAAWPEGSVVRTLAVIEPSSTLVPAMPGAPTRFVASPELERQIEDHLAGEIEDLVGRLRTAGIAAEGAVVRGRPATVIVDEAHRVGADLVVVGSRGHGSIASLVLGSVSAEVVDHAPAPVLVARGSAHRRVLFGSDGSASAGAAEALLAAWPLFADATIRVLSVAEDVRAWHTGVAPTMVRQVAAAHAAELKAARSAHETMARDAAERLTTAGRAAESNLRVGDAAAELLREADDWRADLVVLGSRGRTGLTRILLGSVARNVLQGSRSSVLIVRDRSGDAAV